MRSRYGHIQKMKNGNFRAYWTQNGIRKDKCFRSYKEASDHLARMQIITGKVDTNITYEEYYTTAVIPTFKNLSKRTKYEYRQSWSHVKPYLSKVKIADTNWRLIQSIVDDIPTPVQQRKDLAFIRKMLNLAVNDEIITSNPYCTRIKTRKERRQKKVLWTKEELIKILYFVDNTEFALPILMECCCGLRHEELCGLNRRDFVPTDDHWIQVEIKNALTSVNGKKVLKESKTETSDRTVVIPNAFFNYVQKNIHSITNKKTLKEYISPQTYSRHWLKFCREHTLKHVKFGNMRSVYATLCSEAGCLDSIVSMSMGHSDGSVRSKNYQTATIKALKVNATIFSDYLGFKY